MLGTKTKPDRQTDRHRQTPWPADVSLLAGSNEGNYSSRLDACSLLFSSLLFYYLSPLRDFLFDFHLSSLSLPFPHSHSPVFFFFPGFDLVLTLPAGAGTNSLSFPPSSFTSTPSPSFLGCCSPRRYSQFKDSRFPINNPEYIPPQLHSI